MTLLKLSHLGHSRDEVEAYKVNQADQLTSWHDVSKTAKHTMSHYLKRQPKRKPTCSTKKCQQNPKAYLIVWEEQFRLLAAPPAAARVEQTVQGSRLGHQLMFQPLNQLASTQVFATLHTTMNIRHTLNQAERSKHKLLLPLPGLLKQGLRIQA